MLLLDAWGPGHSRASSGGESRIIRMGYGADEIYTRMAMHSLSMWRALFERTGHALFHRTGVLWMGREGDAYSEATRETLKRADVAAEIIPFPELVKRYPQIHLTDPSTFGIFEPQSGALMARRAAQAVVQDAGRKGVKYLLGAVEPPSGNGSLPHVRTAAGQTIEAEAFVFACGPWLPKLFPDLLRERIFPTRQEELYFAPPAGDSRFAAPNLPVWIDFTDPRGPYGFPDLEGRGFKLAFDRHGAAFDPDSGDRRVCEESISAARRFLAERFPDLRDAPLTETRVCQYENTSSGDFLIDQHPDFKNVWLVGGGSGHGFKHGPAVGEHASGRILHGTRAEPRFSLATKAQEQERAVY